MPSLKPFIFYIWTSFAFASCSNPPDSPGCPLLPAIAPLPRANIQEVNVFMDASGSMKGFMNHSASNTDFQSLVADLLSRMQRNFPNTNFFALSQSNMALESQPINTARMSIANGHFFFGNSSTLPAMFDTCINHLTPGKVSILITDAIYTPTAANTRMKYQEATDIENVFSKALRQGMVTACLGFRSAFADSNSLYYLFIIGSVPNVSLVRSQVKNSLGTLNALITNKGFNEADFGFPVPDVFYSIIPYTDNSGSGEPVTCPIKDTPCLVLNNVDVHTDTKFWIGLDLAALPDYAQEEKYLKQNLDIAGNGLKATLEGNILSAGQFTPNVTDPTDKTLSAKCTHFIKLNVTDIDGKVGEIVLSLKKKRPAWIGEWTHEDAEHAEKIRNKTYGLDNVVTGMEDVYRQNDQPWLFKDLKIDVIKKQ